MLDQGNTNPDFRAKLAEIHREISVLPPSERARLQAPLPAPSTNASTRQALTAAAASLQESIDSLRLSVKYLAFDLEATRRENAVLRRLLADSCKDEPDQTPGSPDDRR